MGKITLSDGWTFEQRQEYNLDKHKAPFTFWGFTYNYAHNPCLIDIINDLDDKINTDTKAIVELTHSFNDLLALLKSELGTKEEIQRIQKLEHETKLSKETLKFVKLGLVLNLVQTEMNGTYHYKDEIGNRVILYPDGSFAVEGVTA